MVFLFRGNSTHFDERRAVPIGQEIGSKTWTTFKNDSISFLTLSRNDKLTTEVLKGMIPEFNLIKLNTRSSMLIEQFTRDERCVM